MAMRERIPTRAAEQNQNRNSDDADALFALVMLPPPVSADGTQPSSNVT